jgi:hypothetical protein
MPEQAPQTAPEPVEDQGQSITITFPDNVPILARVVNVEALSQDPARAAIAQSAIDTVSASVSQRAYENPINGSPADQIVAAFWNNVSVAAAGELGAIGVGREAQSGWIRGGNYVARAMARLSDRESPRFVDTSWFVDVVRVGEYLRLLEDVPEITFEELRADLIETRINNYEWTPHSLVNRVLNWNLITSHTPYARAAQGAIAEFETWLAAAQDESGYPGLAISSCFNAFSEMANAHFMEVPEYGDASITLTCFNGGRAEAWQRVMTWDSAQPFFSVAVIQALPTEEAPTEEAPQDEGLNNREDGPGSEEASYNCDDPECETCNPPTLARAHVRVGELLKTLVAKNLDNIDARKNEISRLEAEIRDLKAFPASAPPDGFPAVEAYISSGEIRNFRVADDKIKFQTGPIYVFGSNFCFGEFDVSISIEHGSVRARAHEGNTESGGLYHPHVDEGGSACLGRTEDDDDFQATLRQLIREGDLDSVVSRLLTFLRSYNPSDPHRKLWFWDRNNEIDENFCEACENSEDACECNWCDSCDSRTSLDIRMCEVCETPVVKNSTSSAQSALSVRSRIRRLLPIQTYGAVTPVT